MRPAQILIELSGGRRRVRRLPRGARMVGASAPWVWRRLQATRQALAASEG